MDLKKLKDKSSDLLKKYKYVAIVLLIGIGLMIIPLNSKPQSPQTSQQNQVSQFSDPTDELQQLLSQIRGAGKVRLMLTLATGERTIYQADKTTDDTSIKVETVIITDSNRTQTGMVQQVLAPQYRGAVVVCQGADDPQVKIAIMEAVKNATGLGYDRISVLKMK